MVSQRVVDLRSDTVTLPTEAMREAMATAAVGDDVYGEDPTVRQLELLAASMVGKADAVLVPSGTMGNQAAVMAHTGRGDEVILEADSHIFFYEVGGLAVLSGVQARTLPGERGVMDPVQVAESIRPVNIHFPVTRLICLESSHNRAGGRAVPLESIDQVTAVARHAGVPVHMDGARIFNAALALKVPVSRLLRDVDSVMFCLSKGLSAPVGSIVAGDLDFIQRARRARKLLGGGMRQAGILAAAGIVALETMVDRLAQDHQLAQELAALLSQVEGLLVAPGEVDTNIVRAHVSTAALTAQGLVDALKERGILVGASGPSTVRLVTHKDVDKADVALAAAAARDIMTQVVA